MSDSAPNPKKPVDAAKNLNKTPKPEVNKKTVNQQKEQATTAAQNKAASPPVGGSSGQRMVECPGCSDKNKVKDKNGGKYIFSITFPFTKFTIRIPNPLALFGKTVTYDENLKDGEKCPLCEGKKKIPDPTDDKAKYEQARQQIQQDADKIMEEENKLGPGGSKSEFIQGSKLVVVGQEFNRNDSAEVLPEGGTVGSMNGDKNKVPQGAPKTGPAVKGIQSEMGWPQQMGNYVIKCGNKFNVLAGGGGITMATKGPITISGGVINFTGPSVTLGNSNGVLALEGGTVAIGGTNVAIAPTSGQTYFRGTVAATGNAIIAGHTHSEGLSFIRATCPGINKESSMDQANKDASKTESTIWTYKATSSAILEIMMYVQAIPSSASNVKRIIAVEGIQSLFDRIVSMAKQAMPFDNMMMPTGIAIGVGNLGYPVISQVFNFPHHHGIPNMHHTHNTKQPDITLEDSKDAVRKKVYTGALTGGAPANVTEDGGARKLEGLIKIAESTYGLLVEGFNFVSRMFKQS